MAKISYLINKGGARLLDCLVDSDEIDILVTGPGMLFKQLELVTNLSAFEGCDAGFFIDVAKDIEATIYCGHQPPEIVDVNVESHRTGMELTINLGPPSMYQSLVKLCTRSGRTFRDLLIGARGNLPEMMAAFNVVRAGGHQEHHASAHKTIREHAQKHLDHSGH